MMKKINIAVVDDHEIFRKSLIHLLSNFKHIHILQEASNGRELVDKIDSKKIDVILLDIDMPIMNGAETFKYIKNKFPKIKVIILSMHSESLMISDLIMSGVNGYVTKGSSIETLIETLNQVNQNDFYFQPNISSLLINQLKNGNDTKLQSEKLTPREIEILHLICQGKSHKQIANNLYITTRTVDFHKSNLYKKTNSNCNANLFEFAMKHGIVKLQH